MTRSHKYNDKDHNAENAGLPAEEHLPRYFAKSGFADTDPKKTKKDGGGKGNWGRDGDEVEDYGYNMTNPRRRSNSSSFHNQGKDVFKTKFETVETEPVFEEELHGAPPPEEENELDKQSTGSSRGSTDNSIEEEEAAHKKA